MQNQSRKVQMLTTGDGICCAGKRARGRSWRHRKVRQGSSLRKSRARPPDDTMVGRGPRKGRYIECVGEIAATSVVFGVVCKQHWYYFGRRWKGECGESGPVQRRLSRGIGEDYKQPHKTNTKMFSDHLDQTAAKELTPGGEWRCWLQLRRT